MQKRTAFDTAGGQVIILSAFTLLVKALGFIKQAVIAACFGAGGATDIFFVASDFFADLSAVFFSPLAIVFLTSYDVKLAAKGRGFADSFAMRTLRDFSLASAVLAAFFAVFSMPAAKLLGFGFSFERQQQLAQLIRILSVGLVFYCAAALLTALLQAQKHFLPAQGRGLVRSAAIILTVWLFSAQFGAGTLTFGLLIGLVFEVLFLLLCAKNSVQSVWSGYQGGAGIRENKLLIASAAPLVLSHAAAEFSHIVDKAIASRLHEGAVSALSYAQVLQSFAVALLVSNVGAVTFSHFSEKSANSDTEGMLQSLCRASELLILLLLPISVVMVAASPSLVELVYARGSFDAAALHITSRAFSGYAVGLMGLSLQTVFLRGLYAQGNTRLPLKIGLYAIILNVLLSLALSRFFGVGGIAFASAVSYFFGAAMSSSVLKRRRVISSPKAVGAAFLGCVTAVALAGLLPLNQALLRCVVLGMAGLLSYCAILLLMREPNAMMLVRYLNLHKK